MAIGQVTESIVETATPEWFEGLGYFTLNAPKIAQDEPNVERQSYAETVLSDRAR